MSELDILTNIVLKNLSRHGQLDNSHEAVMHNAVSHGLDETIFTICKTLIDLGHTNQELNNELALEVLGNSLIQCVPVIKRDSGQFQKLFYSWINSQGVGEVG
jgi:hypothetical protein